MINREIRRRMVDELRLSEQQATVLDQIYGSCTHDDPALITALASALRLDLADLHSLYARVEKELRAERENVKSLRSQRMSFFLHERPLRNQIVKEVAPDFFVKNNIEPTPFASDDWLKAAVPSSFSLASGMSEAKDQVFGGHCTTFAVVGALDYLHGKIDLSESCLTHEAEKRHGDCNEGLAIEHAMETATALGVVPQGDWKNDPAQTCWAAPPDVTGKPRYKFNANRLVFYRPAAAVLKVMEGQLLNGVYNTWQYPVQDYSLAAFSDSAFPQPQNFVRLTKATLANAKTPVVVSIPVWWKDDGHFDAGWENGPDVHMPTPTNLQSFLNNSSPPNVSGWHAVAICGYDDRTSRFEFKNSWNRWWGTDGFGTLPYDYITAYARTGMHGWI